MLQQEEFEQLLDDIKIIAKASKVVCDENDQIKRQYAFGLVSDLVDRLYNDMRLIAGLRGQEKLDKWKELM